MLILRRTVADSVANLVKAGFNVHVEKGAGSLAQFTDAAYEAAGAKIVSPAEAFKGDIVTKAHHSLGRWSFCSTLFVAHVTRSPL